MELRHMQVITPNLVCGWRAESYQILVGEQYFTFHVHEAFGLQTVRIVCATSSYEVPTVQLFRGSSPFLLCWVVAPKMARTFPHLRGNKCCGGEGGACETARA